MSLVSNREKWETLCKSRYKRGIPWHGRRFHESYKRDQVSGQKKNAQPTLVQECRHAFVIGTYESVVLNKDQLYKALVIAPKIYFINACAVDSEKIQKASRVTAQVVKSKQGHVFVLIIWVPDPFFCRVSKIRRR